MPRAIGWGSWGGRRDREQTAWSSSDDPTNGPSPHMRGKRDLHPPKLCYDGSIPAHAGETGQLSGFPIR